MDEFRGRTVIVTGGSRGIGRACCRVFSGAGASVVFTYCNSSTESRDLVAEIEERGGACCALQADVRDPDACRRVVETAKERFKKIDVLINNAGIARDKALMMMTREEWSEVMETNAGGVFMMTKASLVTFLRQKEGCIINMSSVSGIVGIPRQTNYSASKAAIIGFSKALAKEVAPYGVRVNVVCPGYIDTGMVGAIREQARTEIVKGIPLKRLGTPEEVAQLCLFLASDNARYITGDIIKIDGGSAI